MLIGIISDTHDNAEMTVKALEYLSRRKIEFLIHAGDLTSPGMLKYFKNFKCVFALGNCDTEKCSALNTSCRDLGLDEFSEMHEFTAEGKTFIVFHGNNVPAFRDAVSSGRYNYIIKGHTHFYEDYRRNGAHIINPGSLAHGDETTICILDTLTDRAERVDLFI
ncbi:MAG: YfcE family phosphodiesterase [Spirochaetes bacterium]|nr:YfcE family phosphodiesterase [Spirochaetota bacterium]